MFNRLIFGHKNTLAHSQKVIWEVINKPNDVVVIYLEDIMIFREDSENS